jgi:IS30 family transposase
MVNIDQRPPEADDRAVPGHWEGGLLIGKRNASAIATLVERQTGYAMLVPLPDGYRPAHVAPALATKVQTLPEALRRSLRDQGPEMGDWKQVHVDAGLGHDVEVRIVVEEHPEIAANSSPITILVRFWDRSHNASS